METVAGQEKPLQEIFDALPLRSDPEAEDFQEVDEETAARLAESIRAIGPNGAASANIDDPEADPRKMWRMSLHNGRNETTVVNLSTWDCHPQSYHAGHKGEFRRTTVHLRPDNTFAYWGEMDWEANPLSQASANALIKLFS